MGDKKQEKGMDKKEKQEKAQEQHEGEENAAQDTSVDEQQDTNTEIEKLSAKIEQLEKERDDLKDKYLRKAAEFENYKRRTEQDFAALNKYANEQLIADLLPIIDDFERSLHVSKERREFGPFYKGIDMIYQKLKKLLEAKGVKPIESEGKQFNVDLHDALMQTPKPDAEPNTVVEEVEKGYMYNDKVLRHAKVVVAKEPEDNNTENNEKSPEEFKKKENK